MFYLGASANWINIYFLFPNHWFLLYCSLHLPLLLCFLILQILVLLLLHINKVSEVLIFFHLSYVLLYHLPAEFLLQFSFLLFFFPLNLLLLPFILNAIVLHYVIPSLFCKVKLVIRVFNGGRTLQLWDTLIALQPITVSASQHIRCIILQHIGSDRPHGSRGLEWVIWLCWVFLGPPSIHLLNPFIKIIQCSLTHLVAGNDIFNFFTNVSVNLITISFHIVLCSEFIN